MPRVPASRAAARPASSSPNPASMPSSGTLRRRYRSRQPLGLLGERDRRARRVPAAEPAHRQDDQHRPAARRAISHHPRIPAMHPRRLLTAPRAARRAPPGTTPRSPPRPRCLPPGARAAPPGAGTARPAGPRPARKHPGHGAAAGWPPRQAAWQTEAATRLPGARDLGRPPRPTGASLPDHADTPQLSQIVTFPAPAASGTALRQAAHYPSTRHRIRGRAR